MVFLRLPDWATLCSPTSHKGTQNPYSTEQRAGEVRREPLKSEFLQDSWPTWSWCPWGN